jgi:hypothetical protein
MVLRRMRANPERGGGGVSRSTLILPSQAHTAKYRSSGIVPKQQFVQ